MKSHLSRVQLFLYSSNHGPEITVASFLFSQHKTSNWKTKKITSNQYNWKVNVVKAVLTGYRFQPHVKLGSEIRLILKYIKQLCLRWGRTVSKLSLQCRLSLLLDCNQLLKIICLDRTHSTFDCLRGCYPYVMFSLSISTT